MKRVNRFFGRNVVACFNEDKVYSLTQTQTIVPVHTTNVLFCQCPRIIVQNSGQGEVNDPLEDAQYGAEDLDLVRVDEVAAELG